MYTFSSIVGDIIPKSVKCIHSATKLYNEYYPTVTESGQYATYESMYPDSMYFGPRSTSYTHYVGAWTLRDTNKYCNDPTIGELIVRIEFGGVLYHHYNKEPPPKI